MLATAPELVMFWTAAWSIPFRRACCWFTPPPLWSRSITPDALAPRWLRPLCLQRWVGQAIAERLEWPGADPPAAYRFGSESEPCWTDTAWASYDRRCLRQLSEDGILRRFRVEIERLSRIAQEAPKLVGEGDWTSAVLGAGEHIAQLYAELKRRHKAMPARALLRAELARFVAWEDADPVL